MSDVTEIPITGVRKIIAARMSESLRGAAQLSYHATVSAAALVSAREAWKRRGQNIGYEDLLLRAVADALVDFPALNGTVKDDKILRGAKIDACVAIDLPSGLVAPAIWDIGPLSVLEISAARRDVIERAKIGKLSIREMTGGTITLSNLGGTRVEYFTPILNGGQIAILGLGRIVRRPWVNDDGTIGTEPVMGLSLTVDHRVVDGAESGAFLSRIAQLIETCEPVTAELAAAS